MDVYAVGVIVGIIATFVAVIVFWITYIILLLNFKRELKSELKADIKAVDNRLRLVENGVSYIRSFLVGRMPGFSSKEDLDTPTA